MTEILLFRERLKEFYGKYDVFLIPVLRFVLALITYTVINRNIGYMDKLDKPSLVAAVSLVNALLPVNAIVLFAGIFVVIHIYRLSLMCAGVILVLFVLLFLLYFHFAPGDAPAVLLTPLLLGLGLPYVVPLFFGLTGTIFSAIPIACGVVVYYSISYIKTNSSILQDTDIEALSRELKSVIDGISGNRNMRIMIVALGLSCIVVYLIHRLSIKYSWTIAVIAGGVVEMAVLLSGIMKYDTELSTSGVFMGLFLSVAIALFIQFFILSVDYTRTEFLQFQDDEYYYYVKAVPKLSVSVPEKKVKKIADPRREEPEKPTVREEHARPAAREEQARPVRREEPSKPVKREEPSKPVRREEQAKPVRQEEPSKPVRREEQTKPVRREEQAKPVRRPDPSGPAERKEPKNPGRE